MPVFTPYGPDWGKYQNRAALDGTAGAPPATDNLFWDDGDNITWDDGDDLMWD